jgi:hypothetical protein
MRLETPRTRESGNVSTPGKSVTIKGSTGNITFSDVDDWGTGFVGAVSFTNLKTTALGQWTIEFELPHPITSIWNATIVSHVAGHYVIQPVSSNWTIAAGASVSFGLQASGPPGTAPRNRKFNGIAV